MTQNHYSETDMRLMNEFRIALSAELGKRLPERSIQFVGVMLAPSDKANTFRLLIRAKHTITGEGAEMETKPPLSLMRAKEDLTKFAYLICQQLADHFHGKREKVAEVPKSVIIH
jgi:hypothetical protein